MLIYIRHSEDEFDDVTHAHDAKLTKDGKSLAYKRGARLLSKYGIPNVIYCSPFRRTRETLKYMLRNLPQQHLNKIKFIYDPNIGRHFSKGEQENPDVASATFKADIPIYESRKDFHKRIRRATRKLNSVAEKQVVWCVTHTTVYKRVANIYDMDLPRRIPYMHHFIVDPKTITKARAKGKWCSKCQQYH